MGKKVVLLLQGGGALGAFQCGAWKAIEAFLDEHDHELVALAGASIGATNAALIARHLREPGGPAAALEAFWSRDVPTPPLPFIPLPGNYWRAWNGVLTGLLLGNPALFSPQYQYWNVFSEAWRFWQPLYQVDQAKRTLSRYFGRYRGTAPLLAVAATDVESGEAVLFDSASGHVTPDMLAASTAMPILFSPVEINGRHYWDGEVRAETLLPHVLKRLSTTLPPQPDPHDLLVIVVDMFSAPGRNLPASTVAANYRLVNIVFGGKLEHDRAAFEARNAHVDALRRLRALARQENGKGPLAQAIDTEYRKLATERYGRVEVLHIGRQQFEYEYISRDFDYSPDYLARLAAQGEERAHAVLGKYSRIPMQAQQSPHAQERCGRAQITDIRSRKP